MPLARKYQFMEVNTQRRLAGLQEKVPDIQKTLEMARFLKTRKVCASFASIRLFRIWATGD